MRYQDYYVVEREGIYESSDKRRYKYKRIAVPRGRIIAYLPLVSQRKLLKYVPKDSDLNLIHNIIIREFHKYIRRRKKEDLNPVEYVGEIEVADGVWVTIEARRHRDKINLGNHSLIMDKNYQLIVKDGRTRAI